MIWVSSYLQLHNFKFFKGLELARQRQANAEVEVICGCIRRRKINWNHSYDTFIDTLYKKEYGLQQFENDLKGDD